MYYIIYSIIGILVILFSINFYRKDGTTNRKNELYMASIGFLIWPIQIIKILYDLLTK